MARTPREKELMDMIDIISSMQRDRDRLNKIPWTNHAVYYLDQAIEHVQAVYSEKRGEPE